MIIPTLSALTLHIYSIQSASIVNRIKDDILKSAQELIRCGDLRELALCSEKWLCTIFSVGLSRICVEDNGCLVRYEEDQKITMKHNTGICGRVIADAQNEHVKNPYHDPRFNALSDVDTTIAMNFIPIKHGNNVIAVMQIPDKAKGPRSDSLMMFGNDSNSPTIQFSKLFLERYLGLNHILSLEKMNQKKGELSEN